MSKEENQIGYKFTILNEDVATQDLFEDKTHERVSENLFQIINRSSKGVTIGLEGSWGSGKSTVIKLLKDKLIKEGEGKNLFFMFDAWAHDGDPLRRIFLESLIRAIDPNNENNELKEIKARITGRKKTVEVKAKKSTSLLGKLISLSALTIPFGSALLGKVDYDNLFFPWYIGTPYFRFIFGCLFCFSPLIVLALWCRWGEKDPDTKKTSWEFFSVESKEDYTQDITENGERTSIEFEDHFQCIIEASIRQKLIKKGIVVIDNLDRVDPEHAKNIWSTLQTFFQKRSNGSVDLNWSDELWFVIPFDRDGFIKIWKANGTNDEVGTSFLKKCFQLIAEVPQPVMSAWSEYAKKCIEDALIQWPESERIDVCSVYVRYMSQLDSSPTPRDIKAFVNQVGLLGAMWGGQVSVESICLYVLFKDTVSTNGLRKYLIENKLPNEYQTISNRPTIFAEVAGLLFGVNQKKGLQLLLGPEIGEALKAGNGKILSKLVNDHGDAFWIAYEASKKQWMIGGSHTDDYKIAFTKAFHSGLLEHKTKVARDIETVTKVWIDTLWKCEFSQFDYSETMNFICDLCSDQSKNNFLDLLYQFTSDELKTLITKVGTPNFPEKNTENFSKLITFLEIENKPLEKVAYSNLDAKNWKVWLDHLAKYDLSYDRVLPKNGTVVEIANEAQFLSPNFNLTALEYLIKTYDICSESREWEDVADQIINWLKLPNRNFDCESLYEFVTQFSVSENEKISSKIKNCIEGAEFWAAGQSSTVDTDSALLILTAISLEENLQKNSYVSTSLKSLWSNSTEQENLESIFNRFKNLNQVDVIWQLCRDEKNSLAIKITRNIDDEALYSSPIGTVFIDLFNWADEDEINLIANKLAKNGSFFNNQSDMKDNKDPLLYQSVFKIFYALNDSDICRFIDIEIDKVNKDTWSECIKDNGDLLDLVKSKNHYFSEALTEFLVDLVSRESTIKIPPEFVQRIPNLLGKVTDLDKVVIPRVLDAYIEAAKDYLCDVVFEKISPFFREHIKKISEDTLMLRLNLWIDSGAKDKIQWLIGQNIGSFKQPLDGLVSRVTAGLKSSDQSTLEIAKMVNDNFNLKIEITESLDQEVEGVNLADTDVVN